MSFPPSCFLIGAQKAGTTTLAGLLSKQTDICLSTPKEPQYFTKNFALGLDWYRERFVFDKECVLIDASPDYTNAPTERFPLIPGSDSADYQDIPKRIHLINPNAKFIYILRDPIKRSYSSYWHNVRDGWEKQSFSASIRCRDRYLVGSDYEGQIANFRKFFDAHQFLFIDFENFVSDPVSTLRECCEFLEVNFDNSAGADSVHANRSYQYNRLGEIVRRAMGSNRNFKNVMRVLNEWAPDSAKQYARAVLSTSIPPIEKADEEFLSQIFGPMRSGVESMTGLNLEGWRR